MRRVFAFVLTTGCGFAAPSNGVAIDAAPGGDAPTADAFGTGLDAASPTICLGPAGTDLELCLGHTTTLPDVALPADLDTDTSPLCLVAQPTRWLPEQPAACFVVGSNVTVPATTTATGSRPLVLVGIDTIAVGGSLDVSSPRGRARGAGSGTGTCPAFAQAPQEGDEGGGSGGGAGGTFTSAGGVGGDAIEPDEGTADGGTPAPVIGTPTTLRGGCDGQAGADNDEEVGHGGGAVYLVAGTAIVIGGSINASGGGADGDDGRAGGNGGGSGGMIILHAPTVTVGGSVRANGGGGSAGGSNSNDGAAGGESALVATAAPGGAGPGGDGGDGYAVGTGPEAGRTTSNGGGGGGGGGGAGYVRSNVEIVGASSPPVVIVP